MTDLELREAANDIVLTIATHERNMDLVRKVISMLYEGLCKSHPEIAWDVGAKMDRMWVRECGDEYNARVSTVDDATPAEAIRGAGSGGG